jgi:hypothetical protein
MASQAISAWTISPFTTAEEIRTVKQEGWFQLTQASQHPDRGSIESMIAFNSANKIIHLEFDYLSWGGNGGQGLAIYLFDASVAGAGTGGVGGVGLGYVKMIGAYIGVGLDESSSFTVMEPNNMTENTKDIVNGSALTIRGSQARGYARDSSYKFPASSQLFSQSGTRKDAIAAGSLKHVSAHFKPKTPQPGFTIDFSINGQIILSNFDYPRAVPVSIKLGVVATNGDRSSNHEIRNLKAEVVDPTPPVVDLFRNLPAYIGSPGFEFPCPFLTDGDRTHRGWDGSGPWDNLPVPDHLDYYIELGSPIEFNTVVVYSRQDDGAQQEPSDIMTFTQYGAIDMIVYAQDQYGNVRWLADTLGNNLVKRTFTIPQGQYSRLWVDVNHGARHGASLVAVEGHLL